MNIKKNGNLLNSLQWVTKSLEYPLLCQQIYNNALYQFKLLTQQKDFKLKKNAIVMDLDETVIDNSEFQVMMDTNNLKYSEELWAQWVNREKSKLVPGAKNFLMHTKKENIQIIYISNRGEDLLQPTINNLKKLNIYQNNEIFLLRKNINDSKENRRNEILNGNGRMENYPNFNIIQYFGDQYEDFHCLNTNLFGVSNFIFPNPIYFKM